VNVFRLLSVRFYTHMHCGCCAV